LRRPGGSKLEQLQRNGVSQEWKDVFKRGIFGLSIPLISISYPILNQNRGNYNSLFTFVDEFIPFNKFFILPYVSWYMFIVVFSAFLCVLDKQRYIKLLITLNIGMITSYIIFYFYPTYVPRPIITRTDFFSNLVSSLYAVDKPYNCFPSIHVLDSVLIAMYTCRSEKVGKLIKVICGVMAVSIILSIMFIKQHYFADVIAGIIFACILYFSVENVKFNFDKDKNITYVE